MVYVGIDIAKSKFDVCIKCSVKADYTNLLYDKN